MISLDEKSTLSLKLAVCMAPLVSLLEKYVYNDWDFLRFLAIVIAVDTLLSLYFHFKNKSIASKGFAQLFEKVIVYGSLLILTHGLKNYSVGGQANEFFPWIDRIFYAAIMVREAISILENVGKINPGLLPAWILKRLKDFNETGNPSALSPS